MHYAFSTLGCPAWSLEQVVRTASDLGYAGVELRLIDGEVITAHNLRANEERIRRLFGPEGVRLIGLSTSARFSASDDAERRQNEDAARECLAVAAQLGVPLIRVFGGRRPEGVTIQQGIDNVADSLNRLAPAAEQSGVTIVLETHDDFSSAATVALVMDRVPSRSVGILWDTHHPYRVGESVEQVWQLIHERLAHVHLKDARRRGEGWQLVLLGEGEVPNREVIQLLREQGYDGYVSVEWEKKWHPEIPDPDEALPQHIAKLREWEQG